MKVPIKKSQKIQVTQAEDIYPVMREILLRENKVRRKQEYFWVIALNSANHIDTIELVALGGTNRVNVKPVDVFSIPLQKRCTNLILVHNHPGGQLKASEADIAFTQKMLTAADVVEITIFDHLIITEDGYVSVMEKK